MALFNERTINPNIAPEIAIVNNNIEALISSNVNSFLFLKRENLGMLFSAGKDAAVNLRLKL